MLENIVQEHQTKNIIRQRRQAARERRLEFQRQKAITETAQLNDVEIEDAGRAIPDLPALPALLEEDTDAHAVYYQTQRAADNRARARTRLAQTKRDPPQLSPHGPSILNTE